MGIANTLDQSGGFFDWDYRPYFRVPDEFFPVNYVGRELVQAHETPLVEHIDPRAREYLQDFHLWEAIADQVHGWLQPSDWALEQMAQQRWFFELDRPILSMHVRLGDNLDAPNRFHPIRPVSYYHQALDIMEDEKYGSLVVFSDNARWCREQFGTINVDHYFQGIPRAKEHLPEYRTAPIHDWLDFHMMAACDLHIIGNSTYAWWAAFLSRNRTAIYPKPWFGPELPYIDDSLMFPEGWTAIDHGQLC